MKKAVFLDRDGTINKDPGYLSEPGQMSLLPDVGKALALLREHGFLLIVISNQSGVGRGLILEENIPKINARLDELLDRYGGKIDHYELCFHRPEDDCACRKPKPKLIFDAAKKFGVDLKHSYMVGDKISDIEAGRLAKCAGVALVRTGCGVQSECGLAVGKKPDFIGDSLLDIAHWIRDRESANS